MGQAAGSLVASQRRSRDILFDSVVVCQTSKDELFCVLFLEHALSDEEAARQSRLSTRFGEGSMLASPPITISWISIVILLDLSTSKAKLN